MIDQKELLALLQNGANPDKLCQEFANAMNAAIAQKEEADKKAAEEAAKKAKLQKQKKTRIMGIVRATADLLKDFYPNIYDAEAFSKLTEDEVVAAFDEAYAQAELFSKSTSAINDFLKDFNL